MRDLFCAFGYLESDRSGVELESFVNKQWDDIRSELTTRRLDALDVGNSRNDLKQSDFANGRRASDSGIGQRYLCPNERQSGAAKRFDSMRSISCHSIHIHLSLYIVSMTTSS